MTQETHLNPSSEDISSSETEKNEGHDTIFNDPQINVENAEKAEFSKQSENTKITEEQLRADLEAMKEKWLRSEAENQNLRARHKKELDDTRQYAIQKFARDVVDAAENLRRGVDSLPKPSENEDPILTKMREGFESTERSFLNILERNGIVCEDPTGAPFDANKHQAMSEQPSAEHPAGTVIQSWTPTWTLNGRLLKPAMVVVAKAEQEPK